MSPRASIADVSSRASAGRARCLPLLGGNRFPVFYLLHGDSDASWSSVGRAGFILDNTNPPPAAAVPGAPPATSSVPCSRKALVDALGSTGRTI